MDKADYPRCKTCKWWGPDRGELFRWCSNPVNRDFRGENPAGACDGSTTWPDAIVRCKAERDALSARIAACEERCKELEAGILAIVKYPRGHHKYCDCPLCGVTKGLCSLLAPKAEGERDGEA